MLPRAVWKYPVNPPTAPNGVKSRTQSRANIIFQCGEEFGSFRQMFYNCFTITWLHFDVYGLERVWVPASATQPDRNILVCAKLHFQPIDRERERFYETLQYVAISRSTRTLISTNH
jgi:hypothetical protein